MLRILLLRLLCYSLNGNAVVPDTLEKAFEHYILNDGHSALMDYENYFTLPGAVPGISRNIISFCRTFFRF
ncbi:MAG: hypothetical protein PHW04_12545 [Candidatus Wallbacteria bacterium]|nr:hypothetical protein [Candidatus Wallbacteria bacterium]